MLQSEDVSSTLTWTLSDILNRLLWSLESSSLSTVDSVSSMIGVLIMIMMMIMIMMIK